MELKVNGTWQHWARWKGGCVFQKRPGSGRLIPAGLRSSRAAEKQLAALLAKRGPSLGVFEDQLQEAPVPLLSMQS